MFSSTLLLAIAALSTMTTAQNYSTSGPLTVDLTQINSTTLTQWCASERGVCPLVCGGTASPNTCDPSNVEGYVCTCLDGSKPNISDYAGTIPSLVCEQWVTNCVLNHPMDEAGQQGCLSVKCGSKDARENVPNTTTTTSASSTPTSATTASDQTGTPSSTGAAPTTTTGAATALYVGQTFGTGILASGLLGLFALFL